MALTEKELFALVSVITCVLLGNKTNRKRKMKIKKKRKRDKKVSYKELTLAIMETDKSEDLQSESASW